MFSFLSRKVDPRGEDSHHEDRGLWTESESGPESWREESTPTIPHRHTADGTDVAAGQPPCWGQHPAECPQSQTQLQRCELRYWDIWLYLGFKWDIKNLRNVTSLTGGVVKLNAFDFRSTLLQFALMQSKRAIALNLTETISFAYLPAAVIIIICTYLKFRV